MKPYVYIIQNSERTHWYVGMRSANRCPAIEDTGYWGSSDYLDELIEQTGKDQWKKTIVAEFDTVAEASEHETELLELMWDWDGRVNKAKSGFIDYKDPQVKAKHLAGCQKRSEDPVYQANHKAGCKVGAQKRYEDPEYREKHKAGREKMKQDPVWQANQKVGGQKRAKPFIATSIATGEEFYCESGFCDQAKALELDSGNVSKCLNGNRNQHNGFTFRYV